MKSHYVPLHYVLLLPGIFSRRFLTCLQRDQRHVSLLHIVLNVSPCNKTVYLSHLYMKRTFYQDRLGTNIGKNQKRDRFLTCQTKKQRAHSQKEVLGKSFKIMEKPWKTVERYLVCQDRLGTNETPGSRFKHGVVSPSLAPARTYAPRTFSSSAPVRSLSWVTPLPSLRFSISGKLCEPFSTCAQNKTSFVFKFSYVCPEPVLVNIPRVFVSNGIGKSAFNSNS